MATRAEPEMADVARLVRPAIRPLPRPKGWRLVCDIGLGLKNSKDYATHGPGGRHQVGPVVARGQFSRDGNPPSQRLHGFSMSEQSVKL